jgi:two-component system sensor histidine kinase RpfC
MAISRELVELLGGSIDFHSTAGQGSSFWFIVPVRPITQAQTPTPDLISPRSNVHTPAPRILIVGASVTARGAYSTWLGRWGFEAVACDSAAQAITRLAAASANRPYDLVMVCVGGIDLVPEEFRAMVHADPRLSNVPLVLVGEKNATLAAKSGYIAVVPPPASQPLLFNAIHFALGEQRRSPGVVDFGECRIQRPLKSRGLRILLAEDTAVNRQVVGRSLEKAGHRVHVVSDGELALEELENESFDVAIIDLHMPGLGGLEVARAYRYMCAGKNAVPLLALTADALPGVKEQCMAAGFAAYITKPVDPTNLLTAIESLVALGHVEPAAKPARPEEGPAVATELLLDPDTMSAIADLDEDGSFAAELFETFQREGEAALATLERSFQLRQWGLFRETVRGIYGSASSLGANRLWRVCARAEAMSEREVESSGEDVLEEIRKAFEETRMALPVHPSYKSWRGGAPGSF